MSYFCHSVTCGGRRQAAPVWLNETLPTIRQTGHAVVRVFNGAVLSGPQQRREAPIAATPRQVALSDLTGPNRSRYKYSPPLVVLLFSDCKGTFAAFPTLYSALTHLDCPVTLRACYAYRYLLQSRTLGRQYLCATITKT
ncbi:hypothetical protein GE21DRAFT_1349729 [Neurospora crassa]|nr:hypothetical protein GE21DRAFT_1349729 [Neurospora crassa]